MNDEEIAKLASVDGTTEGWDRIRANLGILPPETTYVLLRALGEQLPIAMDVETVVRDAADAQGQMIAGAIYMIRATLSRGMDTADRVREEEWQSYFAYRERAEELLRKSLENRRQNGVVAAWLMAVAVDSDDSTKADALSILKQATNVPISGYSKLLTANTKKWGGSHGSMWKVAREYADVQPPWSSALIAKAHYEHWLYLYMMDERPAAELEAGAYFQDPATRDELRDLSSLIDGAESEDPYEKVFAHDVMAAVLAEAGMRRDAARHLRKVGKFGDPALLTGGPWWRRALARVLKGLPPW